MERCCQLWAVTTNVKVVHHSAAVCLSTLFLASLPAGRHLCQACSCLLSDDMYQCCNARQGDRGLVKLLKCLLGGNVPQVAHTTDEPVHQLAAAEGKHQELLIYVLT